MKIGELISKLQDVKAVHGDIEVGTTEEVGPLGDTETRFTKKLKLSLFSTTFRSTKLIIE